MIDYSVSGRVNPKEKDTPPRFYASAQTNKTMSLDEFSKHIASHGCVYKRADIAAVLTMAVDCLREMLLTGYKIELGDMGNFYISLSSEGTLTAKEFNPIHHVKSVNVNWERGLSFLEFNYMLMQGYDFLVLYRKYGCQLELGGDDQWSNILAGANLIRVKEQQPAFAMTFTLMTTSDGKKMGKTAKGAVWLDEYKTTPYEFYQYWRNIADDDVEKCMKLLTFLPLEEIAELCAHRDERINKAKEVLAYELTKEVHGEEKAKLAESQAKAAFGGGDADRLVKEGSDVTTVVDAMVAAGVAKSKGEARRLIEQGGVVVDDTKVTDPNMPIPAQEFVLHKGKKVHLKVVVK